MNKRLKYTAALIMSIAIFFTSSEVYAYTFKDRQEVVPNKVWTVEFTDQVGFDEATKKAIEVFNKDRNEKVNTSLEAGKDSRTVIINPPSGGYIPGDNYTIIIGTKAHSKKNKPLKKIRKFNFTVKKEEEEFKVENFYIMDENMIRIEFNNDVDESSLEHMESNRNIRIKDWVDNLKVGHEGRTFKSIKFAYEGTSYNHKKIDLILPDDLKLTAQKHTIYIQNIKDVQGNTVKKYIGTFNPIDKTPPELKFTGLSEDGIILAFNEPINRKILLDRNNYMYKLEGEEDFKPLLKTCEIDIASDDKTLKIRFPKGFINDKWRNNLLLKVSNIKDLGGNALNGGSSVIVSVKAISRGIESIILDDCFIKEAENKGIQLYLKTSFKLCQIYKNDFRANINNNKMILNSKHGFIPDSVEQIGDNIIVTWNDEDEVEKIKKVSNKVIIPHDYESQYSCNDVGRKLYASDEIKVANKINSISKGKYGSFLKDSFKVYTDENKVCADITLNTKIKGEESGINKNDFKLKNSNGDLILNTSEGYVPDSVSLKGKVITLTWNNEDAVNCIKSVGENVLIPMGYLSQDTIQTDGSKLYCDLNLWVKDNICPNLVKSKSYGHYVMLVEPELEYTNEINLYFSENIKNNLNYKNDFIININGKDVNPEHIITDIKGDILSFKIVNTGDYERIKDVDKLNIKIKPNTQIKDKAGNELIPLESQTEDKGSIASGVYPNIEDFKVISNKEIRVTFNKEYSSYDILEKLWCKINGEDIDSIGVEIEKGDNEKEAIIYFYSSLDSGTNVFSIGGYMFPKVEKEFFVSIKH